MTLSMGPDPIFFWGEATPGLKISLSIQDRGTWITRAFSNGTWLIEVDPQNIAYNLTVALSAVVPNITTGVDEIWLMQELHNVAIGRVFLCSGQSNMEMSVNAACVNGKDQCTREIQDSINYPYLRMFTVRHDNSSEPLEYLRSPPGISPTNWLVSEPSSFYPDYPEKGHFAGMEYFSATCYFFGRELYKKWNGTVPIGLISATWGGTRIQSWTRIEVMKSECDYPDTNLDEFAHDNEPQFQTLLRKERRAQTSIETISTTWDRDLRGGESIPDASLYNAMIHPLRHMSLTGFAWYQGEANCDEAELYKCLFPTMITDWRQQFVNGANMPFVFVQLAPHTDTRRDTRVFENVHFEDIRYAQAKGGLGRVNNTFMAVALDLGDALSPLSPIHPRRKQQVGSRLAMGMNNLLLPDNRNLHENSVDTGPLLLSYGINYEQEQNTIVFLTFDPLTSKGLFRNGGADCDKIGPEGPWCCEGNSPFEILMQHGTEDDCLNTIWLPMDPDTYSIDIESSQIKVRIDHRGSGRAIRLGLHWRSFPECILYNEQGLPAPPFVIDL